MSGPRCFAVYERATGLVVNFLWADRPPALRDHPALDSRPVPAPPPWRAAGYRLDAAGALTPSPDP